MVLVSEKQHDMCFSGVLEYVDFLMHELYEVSTPGLQHVLHEVPHILFIAHTKHSHTNIVYSTGVMWVVSCRCTLGTTCHTSLEFSTNPLLMS